MSVCIFKEIYYFEIIVVNLVAWMKGVSLYTVIIVATTRVFILTFFVFVCLYKLFPLDCCTLFLLVVLSKYMPINVFLFFSSNQQLKYSTLKKKVAELIKVTQGTQASPSMFPEKGSHAW